MQLPHSSVMIDDLRVRNGADLLKVRLRIFRVGGNGELALSNSMIMISSRDPAIMAATKCSVS
jgi:hypothetical protein